MLVLCARAAAATVTCARAEGRGGAQGQGGLGGGLRRGSSRAGAGGEPVTLSFTARFASAAAPRSRAIEPLPSLPRGASSAAARR